jgi:hypothetical protein
VKSLAQRAAEIAQATWNSTGQPNSGNPKLAAANASELSLPAATVGDAPKLASPPQTDTLSPAAAPSVEPGDSDVTLLQMSSQSAPREGPAANPTNNTPTLPAAESGRMAMLMSRLGALGGIDPHLATWGTSGNLYRFHCQATLRDSTRLTRHFESVASEPLAAVEDVVAKVQAWRTAQRDRSQIR